MRVVRMLVGNFKKSEMFVKRALTENSDCFEKESEIDGIKKGRDSKRDRKEGDPTVRWSQSQ